MTAPIGLVPPRNPHGPASSSDPTNAGPGTRRPVRYKLYKFTDETRAQ